MKRYSMIYVLALGLSASSYGSIPGSRVDAQSVVAPAGFFFAGCGLILVILARPRNWSGKSEE